MDRSASASKKFKPVTRSSSFVRRQSGWDKAIPRKVRRTARPRPSSCVGTLNSPDLDRSRSVTTNDPTPKWRINTDQCSNTVLMGLEQILLAVRDQAHSLGSSIAL